MLNLKVIPIQGTPLSMIPMAVRNFDYFPSVTLNIHLNLSTLQILVLDNAIAIHPLVLVIITYYVLIELQAKGCTVVACL